LCPSDSLEEEELLLSLLLDEELLELLLELLLLSEPCRQGHQHAAVLYSLTKCGRQVNTGKLTLLRLCFLCFLLLLFSYDHKQVVFQGKS
jgi:hypothetical protein